MILFPLEREQLAPFFEYNVYLDEGHGCWLWKLTKFHDGYGELRFRGKNLRIHRLSYAVFNEDFDDALQVLHTCDVPKCINPAHLFLGTHIDNMADRQTKGRQPKGETHGMFGKGYLIAGEKNWLFGKGYLRAGEKSHFFGKTGEKCAASKLRESQVLEILAKHEAGISLTKIAEEYEVSRQNIGFIIRGKTWRDIQRTAK